LGLNSTLDASKSKLLDMACWTLTDPEKRSIYDAWLIAAQTHQGTHYEVGDSIIEDMAIAQILRTLDVHEVQTAGRRMAALNWILGTVAYAFISTVIAFQIARLGGSSYILFGPAIVGTVMAVKNLDIRSRVVSENKAIVSMIRKGYPSRKIRSSARRNYLS